MILLLPLLCTIFFEDLFGRLSSLFQNYITDQLFCFGFQFFGFWNKDTLFLTARFYFLISFAMAGRVSTFTPYLIFRFENAQCNSCLGALLGWGLPVLFLRVLVPHYTTCIWTLHLSCMSFIDSSVQQWDSFLQVPMPSTKAVCSQFLSVIFPILRFFKLRYQGQLVHFCVVKILFILSGVALHH